MRIRMVPLVRPDHRLQRALEFLMAGATAVQVGTANFVDPAAMLSVVEGIESFCIEEGTADIREIIGSLRL